MGRYLDTIPHPWTLEVIRTAIFESFIEARAAIEDTPGGRLWQALSDLQDSLWIFQTSTTELLDEICVFGDRSRDPTFWHDANRADAHTRAVKRYIFNCTSSLMALVDHARAFQKAYPVDEYADRLREFFPTQGLHNFLQCFRNYNTHWRVAEANWNINHNFETGSREARFVINKAELLKWSGWDQVARKYISDTHGNIDVYDVFSKYREHVQKFYAWHKGAVFIQYASTYQPYLEYKRLHDGLNKNIYWNLVLSRASNAINPYGYLGRYLTSSQIEAVLALEHGSADQVDVLIQMLGMGDFCDASLREKAISLFKRSTSGV